MNLITCNNFSQANVIQARRPSSALLDTVKNVRKVFAGRTKSNHQLSKEHINEGMTASSSSTFFQERDPEPLKSKYP